MCVRVSVCVNVCPCVCLSVCLYMFVCLSTVNVYVCLLVFVSVCPLGQHVQKDMKTYHQDIGMLVSQFVLVRFIV